MRTKNSLWFEVGVRYHTTQDDGSNKAVTDRYSVDALSFTEAESAIMEEMAACISGEFEIKSVVQANYGEVVFSDNGEDERWYKCKVQFVSINEANGREKLTNVNYLVQANSIAKALSNIVETMRGTISDYEIISIAATKLIDAFERKTKGE